MSDPKTSARPTLSIRIDPELKALLEEAAARQNVTVSQCVERLLRRAVVDESSSVDARIARIEQLVNRFDGRHRADARVLKELLASFVYLFMLYHPPLPDEVQDAAHLQTSRRMNGFIEFVTESLKQGMSLLNPGDTTPDADVRLAGELNEKETAA
jgi:uncharacterized protein (DUF1778 family)